MDIDARAADIVEEACERYLHQFYPERTNLPDLREGGPATFRKAADHDPVMIHGIIRLDIYMVLRGNGRMHMIMDSVIPEEKIL